MQTKKLILSCFLIAALGLSLGNGCPPSVVVVADVANGQRLYNDACSVCHSISFLKEHADNIISDLPSIDPHMNGLTLTAQQIVDLKAFLATQ